MSKQSSFLVGENYGLTLNQSIQNLLSEIHKKTSNSSNFMNTFFQLMLSKIDPPLESIWVYTALTFKSRKSTNDDLGNRISNARELFRLISGCSGSCSASKSIALLAPVVFEVHNLVQDLGDKKVKKSTKEVKYLIEAVLGYVCVSCSEGMNEESDSNFIASVADLLSIWKNGKDELKGFLPLVSDGTRREISFEGTSVNSFAGVVILEVFLLKLCLDIRLGIPGLELENELKNWIVSSITGCQSFYFFETFMKMLLEPTLPVDSLLSPEVESFVRTILYDAAILVEYSFLRMEKTINLPADRVRSLAVKRLLIMHKAIDYFRKNGDRKRVISYTNSFSNSQLPSQVIRFVKNQIGMEEEASKLKGTPKTLLGWLLNLEGQGIRIFDDRISKSYSVLDDSMPDNEQESKTADADLLFYIGNEGGNIDSDEDDGETMKSMDDAFVAAARTMRNTEYVGGKRKDERVTGRKKKTKLQRDDVSDNSELSEVERSSSITDDSSDSNSESEAKNPSSDEDV